MGNLRGNVLIVGRPNVGKSTLFNRLTETRRALMHDMPGMTRDLIRGEVQIDNGPLFDLVDSGGLEYGDDPLSAFAPEIRMQTEAAIERADVIMFLTDGREGVTPGDLDIAGHLRSHQEKVLVVVNKTDTKVGDAAVNEFFELGFEEVVGVSATHGKGIQELLDELQKRLPEREADEDDGETRPVLLGVVGRPNVGKSSLLNRLADEEVVIVSNISGTTRDTIDAPITRNGNDYVIVDTAGIRRKGKTTEAAEKLSIIAATKAMERCDIALVVLDGTEGVTAQDATVAGYAEDAGCAALILVNKWDIVEKSETLAKETEQEIRRKMKFLSWAPIELISAKSGRRVEKLFPTIDRIAASYRARFTTSQLNRILEEGVRRHAPPVIRSGRPRRFYYATQVRDSPPTIAIFSNSAEPVHFSYKRYLENVFREALDLYGTPIRLVIRSRKGFRKEE